MIKIKLFNDIENAKIGNHPNNIISKIEDIFNINHGVRDVTLMLSSISSEHWLRLLNNRTHNIMISYEFAMFYFEKGIHDQSFPKDTKNINYENLYSYKYFIENFFIGGFSIYENIGHIINDTYNLGKSTDVDENIKISFKQSIKDLRTKMNRKDAHISTELKQTKKKWQQSKIESEKKELKRKIDELTIKSNDILKLKEYIQNINDIRESDDFKDTEKIRNNIVHNNPPLNPENPVTLRKYGLSTLSEGNYIDSKTVKEYMDVFLKQYSEILIILKNILECKDWLKV